MSKLLAALVVAVSAILGSCVEVATADGEFTHHVGERHLTSERAEALYHEAWTAYRKEHVYTELPPRFPVVGFADGQTICNVLGSEHASRCAEALTGGEYANVDWEEYGFPGADILLSEDKDYNSVYGGSVLFHEFIHFLQFYNGGGSQSCPQWLDREREAYTLQARWLSVHNGGYLYSVNAVMMGRAQHCQEK